MNCNPIFVNTNPFQVQFEEENQRGRRNVIKVFLFYLAASDCIEMFRCFEIGSENGNAAKFSVLTTQSDQTVNVTRN